MGWIRFLDRCTGPAPAISRLGINPYQWGTECLTGDVHAGPATSFPASIGLVRFICCIVCSFEYVAFIFRLLCLTIRGSTSLPGLSVMKSGLRLVCYCKFNVRYIFGYFFQNNNFTAHGDYGFHHGLSCWSPVINILRDPRWGWNQVQ